MRAAVIEALGQPLVVRSVDKPAQQFAFYPLAAVRRQLWTNQTSLCPEATSICKNHPMSSSTA